ncbi:Tol-Pal system beta propeller repeat protein TolB [Vogesella sp. LIG4]|uniref:Tol-Pal system beta propeller repeat protein TolB n=1 Tax=Vogesella sp. LIG4 TaxID=1192162 RepID=UPI00082022E2|nr:Tol-Pal system beta propeller repeat protein TolB [Vogesella sp. LIG4]SCK10595.1 TolB protein [Vogesella sp. LIG4]
MHNFFVVVRRLLLLCCLLLAAPLARADLTVDIVGGGANRYPLAVLPLANEEWLPDQVTGTVKSDLAMTGMFNLLAAPAGASLEPSYWQQQGARAMVYGRVSKLDGEMMRVTFWVDALAPREQKLAMEFDVHPSQLRDVAHRMADMVYEALMGEKSLFASRIAFVLKAGKEWRLQVADVDGRRAQTVLRSNEPIISPAWSKDGTRLAYVSFENKKPVVYIQDLSTGQRHLLANFKGSNSAPSWSPDGRRLAVVLTLSGNSQIYLINADGSGLQRFSYSNAIDTEPVWSPDGRSIAFVSDRSGGPQLYIQQLDGSRNARRVTYQGSYNVSPSFSPDGRQLVYVQREGGRFKVMLHDLASGDSRQLSSSAYDESPSFAPNGKMVLYASDEGGRSVLFAAALQNPGRVRLGVIQGEVQNAAWGPFNP